MSERLKILFFCHSLRGRGTERTVIRLLKHFDRTLVEPVLLLIERRGEFLELVPSDIEVITLNNSNNPYNALKFPYILIKFLCIYTHIRPHIVMGVHFTPNRIITAGKLFYPKIKCVMYETDPFSRIEAEKGWYLIRRTISRFLYRKADIIVAASDVVARDLSVTLGIPIHKIKVIPNPCVDNEVFRLSEEPIDIPPFKPRKGPIIINVGNMYSHKSQDVLIKAFSLVLRKIPSVSLVIIGEGPERERLKRLVRNLDLEDKVYFLGFVRNPFKYVKRADVYVSPSKAEGFDISVVEAMSLGIPVVVTSGERYMAVENGKTGIVVPVGDAETMAEAVLSLLGNPELARKIGERGEKEALKLAALEVARRYEEIFLNLKSQV